MSVSSSSNSKVDRLTIVAGLVAILWFPRWDLIYDTLFPIRDLEGYGRSIEEMVQSQGYTLEIHKTVTEDGYKLEFHRISNPNVTRQEARSPVVMAPVCSCTSRVHVAFNNSAGFLFADAGLDVWLLNTRATVYGREHITLDEKKDGAKFYNYTFVEASEYDLVAQIQYIQRVTAKKKVFFTAHSQGVGMLVIMLAQRPAMQDSIEKAVFYGGTASTCFVKSGYGVEFSSSWNYYTSDLYFFFGAKYVGAPKYLAHRFMSLAPVLHHLSGVHDLDWMDDVHIGFHIEIFEERIAYKQASHTLQNAYPGCDGRLRAFDYDFGMFTKFLMWIGLKSSKNIQVYGTRDPPIVDIENFSFPVKIYYSEGDLEITPEAVHKFAERVKIPASNLHLIAEKKFNHFNFLYYIGRFHFIDHAIDFLNGEESEWDPHVFDQPPRSSKIRLAH